MNFLEHASEEQINILIKEYEKNKGYELFVLSLKSLITRSN